MPLEKGGTVMLGYSKQLNDVRESSEVTVHVTLAPATTLGARARGKLDDLLARCGFGGRTSGDGSALESWLRAQSKLPYSAAPGLVGFIELDGAVIVHAVVRGFSAEDLEVSVEPFRVTIRGEKAKTSRRDNPRESGEEPPQFCHIQELPVEVDGSKSTATLSRGTLHIVLPKTRRAGGASSGPIAA